MPKFIDLTGRRFGKLIVVSRAENTRTGKVRWNCLCDCGNRSTPQAGVLNIGNAMSCGCMAKENHARTHGLTKTPEYMVWYQMHERCKNHSHVHFKYYGGRGIGVCDRWSDVSAFVEDMGVRPSRDHQLDRRNNEKGYDPENCRWATRTENARNKRNTLKAIYQGVEMSLVEASELCGVSLSTLVRRMKGGMTAEHGLFSRKRAKRNVSR